MPYNHIKSLLNKKGWTGRELGILEITNMASLFKQRMQGNPNPTPIVEKSQFQKMLSSLTDSVQGRIYNGYIAIHEWLSLHYNIALSQEQQAQLQFRTLLNYVTSAMLAEDVFEYISNLPLIMTQKQYEAIVKDGRDKWIYGENGELIGDSVIALIERAISYYMEQLSKYPNKTNPLKSIKKKYQQEFITSPYILNDYNEVMGLGYYSLEDGRRSDQMTDEEWREIIDSPKIKKWILQLNKEGKLWSASTDDKDLYRTTPEEYAQERLIARDQISYKDDTEEINPTAPLQWHFYDTAPEITKWEFLENNGTLNFFESSIFGAAETSEDFLENAKIFVSEFQELVDVIIIDIDSRYFKPEKNLFELPVDGIDPIKNIASLSIEEWEVTVFDHEQLYEKDVYGFKDDIDRRDIIFDGNWRAMTNGVAILEPTNIVKDPKGIDENGYYTPPNIRNSFYSASLEAFFPEAENYADNLDIVETGKEALLDSYYYIKGYNLVLELIADYYDITDITIFKLNISGIEYQIDAYNNLIPLLYSRIKHIDYEDEKLKEKKLQVLTDILTEIDYRSIVIPEEKIEEVKILFNDFKAFNDMDIADYVCYRPKEDEEGGIDE